MKSQVQDLANVWPKIKNIFSVPHSEEDYQNLVSIVDSLVDEVGEDETHPLASLMESLGTLIETYEKNNIPIGHSNPIDALKYLMKEHDLKQSDLPEVGSQGVVSEILTGKRKLNIRQIKNLSIRFNVSPLVFIQDN